MGLVSGLWAPLLAQGKIFYLEEWYAAGKSVLVPHSLQASAVDDMGSTYLASSKLNAYGKNDLQLEKYGSNGAMLWSQTFSLPSSSSDVLVGDLQIDNAGSVVITGSVYNGAANGYDALTVKYSTNGAKLWQSTYNGSASGDDGGVQLYIDEANNIYVAGATSSLGESMNMLALRYSGSGVQQWAQSVDGYGLYDAAGYLYRRSSNVLAIVGVVQESASTWALGLVRLNLSTGALSSGYMHISSEVNFAEVLAVASDAAGNVYVAGYSNGSNGRDIVAAKLTWQLTLDWQASYDGPGSGGDEPRAITVDSSGNVYIAGITESAAGDSDWLVLKYSSSGALQWASTYGGAAGSDDGALALSVGPQGEIAAAGYANEHGSKDYLTALLDPADGSFTWSAAFNGLANGDDEARQVLVDSTGSITVIGRAALHGEGSTDMALRYAKKTVLELPGATAAAAFVENRGQLADTSGAEVPQVKFYAPGSGTALYAQDGRLSFVLSSVDGDTSTLDTLHRVDMSFYGGKTNSKAFGMGKRDSYHNYYLGHIPEGRARVGLYDKVILSEVYEGVDLQVRAGGKDGGQCFVVKPGGDPSDIKLQFEGQSSLAIDPGTGALEAGSPIGKLLFPQPSAFLMEADGDTEELNWQVAYKLLGDGKVGFDSIGVYDNGKSLVICVGDGDGEGEVEEDDEWVTHFGGTDFDDLQDLHVEEGDLFVAGFTRSGVFPNVEGSLILGYGGLDFVNALLAKFNGSAVLEYLTVFGGAQSDIAHGVSVYTRSGVSGGSSNKSVVVVGSTTSPNFPITVGGNGADPIGGSNGFVGGFSAESGELQRLREIGGSAWDALYAVDVQGGSIMAVGISASTDFPVAPFANAYYQNNNNSNGERDAVILQLNDADLSILWSTYFGGDNFDSANGIFINQGSGGFYVLGNTATEYYSSSSCTAPNPESGFPNCRPTGADQFLYGNGFSSTQRHNDIFIAEFGPNRELLWTTFFGSEKEDQVSSRGGNNLAINYQKQNAFAIVGGTGGYGNLPSAPASGFNQVIEAGHFIAVFEDRKLSWKSGIGCQASSSIPLQGDACMYDEQGNLFVLGYTDCPPVSSIDYCEEPEAGFSPICPPEDEDIFFQVDDAGLPIYQGGTDAFIAAFNGNRDLVYSTYFGGNGTDYPRSATLQGGYLYFIGQSSSDDDFPWMFPPQPDDVYRQDELFGGVDGFIARLKAFEVVSSNEVSKSAPQKLHLYPNPSSSSVQIALPGGAARPGQVCRAFDATGRLIWQTAATGQDVLTVDVSAWPPGMYYFVSYGGTAAFVKQ